ncbi:MAG TPA: hypothetical protein VK716_01375 [Terracidiphilus sp.]|jgi:MraZ protein|nr:hypothetical protein [Terracidiphilus sp.]
MFRGSHEAKIDEKGRLKLPSAFKALMDASNVTQFFVTSTNGKWAEIWPLPEWEKVEARLAKRSALDDAVEEFMNLVNYYGQQVEMDNQGRILLPQILRDKARLTAEVKVMGQIKFLAVHNREEVDKVVSIDGMAPERKSRISGYLTEPD